MTLQFIVFLISNNCWIINHIIYIVYMTSVGLHVILKYLHYKPSYFIFNTSNIRS